MEEGDTDVDSQMVISIELTIAPPSPEGSIVV